MWIPVPFGGVLLLLILFAAVAVGFALLASAYGSSARNAARARAGALVLGGTVAFLLISTGAGELFGVQEWNPYPVSDKALIGTWRDGEDRLDLRADGTYTLAASARPIYGVSSAAGRWSRFDWNLRLDDALGRHAVSLRVVVARGEYRIMPEPGDPDTWNGRLGYCRTPSAKAP
jgi:hypothetical protein